jgi:hypothetical protein
MCAMSSTTTTTVFDFNCNYVGRIGTTIEALKGRRLTGSHKEPPGRCRRSKRMPEHR